MLIATSIQWIGYVIYLSGNIPWNLDINPILFIVSIPMYASGIFKFSLLDLVPVARDTVFEGMKDGVLVMDLGNRLIDYNKVCTKIFPDISKEHIGSDIGDIIKPHPQLLDLLSSGTAGQVEISVPGNGEQIFFSASIFALFNEKGKKAGCITTLNDITRQKNLRVKLEKMASLDELTGIYNRRYLVSLSKIEISKAQRTGRPISILLIDLDYFKTINDNYGHLFGDQVLKAFTQIVKQNIREIDILGRYGGEEFVIILPETDPKTALAIAERVRTGISSNPLSVAGRQLNITVSAGVFGTTGEQALPFDKMLDFADKALYCAKDSGRNKTVLI